MENTKLVERSCVNVNNCKRLEQEDFDEERCRGWCPDFAWDNKTIPSKPEFLTKAQLRTILTDSPNIGTKEDKEELNQKITGLFNLATYVLESKKAQNLCLSPDIILALQKCSDDDQKDFTISFLLYTDLKSKLRAFLKRIRFFDKPEVEEEK